MNIIERSLRRAARELSLKWRNEGRYIIERKIFPKIKNKKVLLVGCASYTSDYPKRLQENELYSIDVNKEVVMYGAKNHIIGSVVDIDKYFEKEFFDAILFFGVFGFGLNNKKEAEKALKNCYNVLKTGGVIMIMWQNIPGHNQISPRELENFKLFKTINVSNYISGYETRKKQIFEFLKK